MPRTLVVPGSCALMDLVVNGSVPQKDPSLIQMTFVLVALAILIHLESVNGVSREPEQEWSALELSQMLATTLILMEMQSQTNKVHFAHCQPNQPHTAK